ncbi:MAG: ATPase [Desulfurococcales archaeon]|nr:ATPase [Desulfurococcales archaeon]
MIRILPTGNNELDIKIGGGIPFPTLIVIEGDHGSGKTALSLQFLLGALRAGFKSVVFTSESRPGDYIVKAESSGFPIEPYYIRGMLRVYTIQYPGPLDRRIADLLSLRLMNSIARLSSGYKFIVVDSLSYLASIASDSILNELIVSMRRVTSQGTGVVVTIHPSSIPEHIAVKLFASADGYLKTSAAVIGGRRLKVLSIVKLRGAPPGIETTITFDVDPAFGIKLVPIMVSQA